jgi:hypothetical protein
VKPKVWDLNGNNTDIDLRRMMKIVMDSGYHGHAGIESGPEGREVEGVKELPQRLETVRDHLSARSL